jgi:hypothetical protein
MSRQRPSQATPANGGSVETDRLTFWTKAAARAVADDIVRREGRIGVWFDPPFEPRRAGHPS